MNHHDTAICERIAEEHATITLNLNVSYCQLTTLRGRLKRSELDYIDAHGCPTCGRGLHENTMNSADQLLAQKSYAAKLAHEAAAQASTEKSHDPGPTIKLAGPVEEAARFGLNSRIAAEIAEEAARVDPNR